MKNLSNVLEDVLDEYKNAVGKYNSFHSAHEGYAVLKEEVDELWDAIKENDHVHSLREARQVAAMALRYLVDVSNVYNI